MTTRRLAAILAADVVGFSKLIGEDEAGTLAALRDIRREIVNPLLAEHGGRVFKLMGDGMLAEFPSAVQALRAAINIQRRMRARNDGHPEGKKIEVRIGVHQGDVVVEGRDLLGDGVNIAARLEALAEPGGVCISGRVHEDAGGKITLRAKDMGEQKLKNIARPVRAYRISASFEHATQKAADNLTLPLPDKPSIAVLPFQNMSGDPEQDYFADGIVEDIITSLSRVRSLFVIARNSSFTYKDKSIDVKQVGRDLGVRYVLEGSVRKAAARIRITCQLIEAATGHHVWAEKFDRELKDIFDIQDEITLAIVASVQTQVDLHEGILAGHISADINVWGLLKKAWGRLLDLNIVALKEAQQLAEEALRLDPNNSHAHALLSVAIYHIALMGRGTDGHDRVVQARELALMSIQLDDKDEFAHWALGNTLQWLAEGDYGISAYRRALELNPNFSLAYGLLGSALIATGRPAEGIEANLKAIRYNPRDPSNFFRYGNLAAGHFALGNFDVAIEWAEKSLGNKKGWFSPHLILIASFAHSGRLDKARTATMAYLNEFPGATVSEAISRPYIKLAPHNVSLVAGLRLAGVPE